MELYRRHRRKIFGAAAVGAAGAAAYYTYKWWSDGSSLEDILRRYGAEEGDGSRPSLSDQEALQQHFVSIQHIPEQKTLPTLLPSLQAALMRAADTSPLKERLRQMKGDRSSSDAKVEAWTQLAHTSFVLAASTAWALPLLDLLLRVQINVLGRRLYFASLKQQAADSPAQPTPAEQHRFLGSADTLAHRGVPQIVQSMRSCVAVVMGGVELAQPISSHLARSLLSDIHTGFEAAAGSSGWGGFLVGKDDPLATPLVAEMVAEVRSVVDSPAFDLALQGAVQQAAEALAQGVAVSIGPANLPLARVVPLIESAADALLTTPDNAVIQGIGGLPAVADLCAFAYAPVSPSDSS